MVPADVSGAGSSAPQEVTHRRVLRGQINREAILVAVVELIEEGNLTPTADQIATRAGVARRSVYHHFDDLDDVTRAVSERYLATYIASWKPRPTEGDLDQRHTTFVAQRSAFAERIMPIYRASRLVAVQSPAMAEPLADTGAFLRSELGQSFGPELAAAPAWTIEALDAMTSLDCWVHLRVNQSLSVRRARRVVDESVAAILSPRS